MMEDNEPEIQYGSGSSGTNTVDQAVAKLNAIKTSIQKMTGYLANGTGTLKRDNAKDLAESKGMLQETVNQLLPIVEGFYGISQPTERQMEKIRKDNNSPGYMNVWDTYVRKAAWCRDAKLDFQRKRIVQLKSPSSKRPKSGGRNRRLAANRRRTRKI